MANWIISVDEQMRNDIWEAARLKGLLTPNERLSFVRTLIRKGLKEDL